MRVVFILIVFGKRHFLLISQNKSFHEIKRNKITCFMDFIVNLVVSKKEIKLESIQRKALAWFKGVEEIFSVEKKKLG